MKCIIIGTFLCLAINAVAQNDRGYIRQGNKKYRTKNLGSAAQSYKDALAKNPQNALAAYNLGRTLQDMKKDSLAIDQYKQAISNDNNNQVASSAHYNMGTIYQKNKDYGKAIEAYKSALRINPKHEKARHNLALCKQKQQEQKQQKQQDNQNKDKKNQNSDDKQQQNKPNNKDKSSQQKQQKNNPQSGNMSKENADQLLSAALQNEKATQERLKKAMQQPQRRTIEKYW